MQHSDRGSLKNQAVHFFYMKLLPIDPDPHAPPQPARRTRGAPPRSIRHAKIVWLLELLLNSLHIHPTFSLHRRAYVCMHVFVCREESQEAFTFSYMKFIQRTQYKTDTNTAINLTYNG